MSKQDQVLIVDDIAGNRMLLKRILGFYGMDVLEAENGQEAVEIACLELPRLILMDLSMPVMDGFEATRRLQLLEATRHIPVVAVSAHCNEEEQRQKAFQAGCKDCLEKPLQFDKLVAILKTL